MKISEETFTESLNQQTKQNMTHKPAMISGQSKEISFSVTSNLELSSMCRKKKHSKIPLKDTDVTGSTHANLDVLQESCIDEYWNVDVDQSLSDSWTGFTKFTILIEKPSKRIFVVLEAAYKNSSNYQT